VRVLVIADSDSYIKWGAAVLQRMPAEWSTDFVVLATPVQPSSDQLDAALAGTRLAGTPVPVLELDEIARRAAARRPDVVLLSLRGPVQRVVIRAIMAATVTRRPVFVTGLPGISIPANRLALSFRSQTDLVLLHSIREVREFAALAHEMGIEQEFALATLPFLPERRTLERSGNDIIFAAQAKVPRTKDDRMLLLGWLAETARRHPHRRVVLKLRGRVGEPQTHAEQFPFDALLDELPDAPPNLVVATGPMSDYLQRAAGLVTISSTAAIEAAALGVPVLALDDFGVGRRQINLVFEGSGLLGDHEALLAADFRLPREDWLEDNYFHPAERDDWVAAIESVVDRRAAVDLPLRRQYAGRLGGPLRHVWDRKRALGDHDHTLSGHLVMFVGRPARRAVLALHAMRRRVRSAA